MRPANLHSKTLSRTKQTWPVNLFGFLETSVQIVGPHYLRPMVGQNFKARDWVKQSFMGSWKQGKEEVPLVLQRYTPGDPTTFHLVLLVNGHQNPLSHSEGQTSNI